MNESITILEEAFSGIPIGESDSFIWFATSIGIAALYKCKAKPVNIGIKLAIKEGLEVSIDLSREENQSLLTNRGDTILFYS